MRSTALQACRHLRPASVGIAATTTTTRILRPLTITLTTTSTSPSSSRSASTTAPRPISSSYARNTGRKTTTTTTTDTASKASEADVDPALAASIPTPAAAAAAATAPANAFNAAISNSTGAGAPNDAPNNPGQNGNGTIDWSSSFHGLSTVPFSPETAQILMKPLDPGDVEIKPDGIIYLPEIKYRRILNLAFGPGGWGLAPRGELVVGEKVVTREYALVVHGRFVAQARGECQYFAEETIPTAGEGCKSNALMRCCKDLGIASELWDPRFIREFKKKHCKEIWVEHVVNKKRRQVWVLKDGEPTYPYKAVTSSSSSSSSGYSRP